MRRVLIIVVAAMALGLSLMGCSSRMRTQTRALPIKGTAETEVALETTSSPAALPASDMTTVEDLISEDIAEPGVARVSDPFQPVNRVMHGLNDRLYNYLLEPVSKAYETVMPDTVERGVANAFTNLRYPKRLVGNVLQGKFDGAARETGKFLVNSTVGVLGLARASDRFDSLTTSPEDFGQTLGRWHIGRGPYLVLPVLGPNTLRDTVGMVGDGFLDPLLYVGSTASRVGARALENVNASPGILADYNALKEGAIDPYIALRDAYVQSRDGLTRQ